MGIAPSTNGKGYARIAASPASGATRRSPSGTEVTLRVHAKGDAIFAQLMHTGRVSHPLNMLEGAEVVAPSAVWLEGAKRRCPSARPGAVCTPAHGPGRLRAAAPEALNLGCGASHPPAA
jgi:2,4-dienoyl-CoA reductase-like NADH-dependent reductase (Old Yellow Enzyme family)